MPPKKETDSKQTKASSAKPNLIRTITLSHGVLLSSEPPQLTDYALLQEQMRAEAGKQQVCIGFQSGGSVGFHWVPHLKGSRVVAWDLCVTEQMVVAREQRQFLIAALNDLVRWQFCQRLPWMKGFVSKRNFELNQDKLLYSRGFLSISIRFELQADEPMIDVPGSAAELSKQLAHFLMLLQMRKQGDRLEDWSPSAKQDNVNRFSFSREFLFGEGERGRTRVDCEYDVFGVVLRFGGQLDAEQLLRLSQQTFACTDYQINMTDLLLKQVNAYLARVSDVTLSPQKTDVEYVSPKLLEVPSRLALFLEQAPGEGLWKVGFIDENRQRVAMPLVIVESIAQCLLDQLSALLQAQQLSSPSSSAVTTEAKAVVRKPKRLSPSALLCVNPWPPGRSSGRPPAPSGWATNWESTAAPPLSSFWHASSSPRGDRQTSPEPRPTEVTRGGASLRLSEA